MNVVDIVNLLLQLQYPIWSICLGWGTGIGLEKNFGTYYGKGGVK